MHELIILLRIDAGGNGGAGLLGVDGGMVQGWRFKLAGAVTIVNELSQVAGEIWGALIEHVQIFRQLPCLRSLICKVSLSIWDGGKGSLIVSGSSWRLIKPVSWHSRLKLGKGQNRVKLAAGLWPSAGLLRQADDGLADGLLIAEVCRLDYLALNVR